MKFLLLVPVLLLVACNEDRGACIKTDLVQEGGYNVPYLMSNADGTSNIYYRYQPEYMIRRCVQWQYPEGK